MRVAVPLFGRRVSPRCVIAREMVLATVESGVVRERRTVRLSLAGEGDLVERLLALEVEVLVCGGIGREVEKALTENGVRVVHNVVGEVDEVLGALCSGALMPGHGFRGRAPGPHRIAAAGTEELPPVDCIACRDRRCVQNEGCPLDIGGLARPWLRGEEARIFEVGQDVSAEMDPKLCRIAELVHFCLGAGYHRIGLAFCWELYREVEILVPVLARFFSVVPICCRVGSGASDRPSCNPVALARLLNREKPDLNVLAGLCLGCDLLFTRRSRAPVTTLFVKDRSLAHNPVGAIYTRYHLMDLEAGGRSSPAPRSGRT